MGCCCTVGVVVIRWVKGRVELMMTMVSEEEEEEAEDNCFLRIIRNGVVCGEEGKLNQFMFFSFCVHLSIYLSTEACMHGRMHTNAIHYLSFQALKYSYSYCIQAHTHTISSPVVTRACTVRYSVYP